jgi:tRNA (guanine37-N1)-methyltransferase
VDLKMKFIFITLFPEMIEQAARVSIIGRAMDQGLVSVACVNPRDYAADRHRSVDDTTCGGGAGMVLKAETYCKALAKAGELAPDALKVALTPVGEPLKQPRIESLAAAGKDIIFLCGHYEGFDERILEKADLRLSVGDFVLTGGELPALCVMDAVARFLPGVLGKMISAEEDSFADVLLEYPQYTRPVSFEGRQVPEVLLSGNHAAIARWRRKEALRSTYQYRPELLGKMHWQKGDGALFLEMLEEEKTKNKE